MDYPPTNSSIRNVLSSTITEIINSKLSDNLQVKLAFGDDHIWANITPWACDDLALTIAKVYMLRSKA